jgi:hypothetical protein
MISRSFLSGFNTVDAIMIGNCDGAETFFVRKIDYLMG